MEVRRSRFHDSCGSGGRMLLQTPGISMSGNTVERFGGAYIWAGEQIYVGGALGLHDVHLSNNTIADPPELQICPGLANVTCADTTFARAGSAPQTVARGCAAPAAASG